MASESPAGSMAAVTEQSALYLRVMAMRQAIERTRAAIALIKILDSPLASRLSERSAIRADEIARGLRAVNPHDLTGCEPVLRAGEELVEETLAFLAAAGARKVGLDQGITGFAEKWLDELSRLAELPRVAVVIPAVTDFTVMTSSIVRLRVTGDAVWGLPVAVHEYGHFVAAHLIRRETVDSIRRSVLPAEDLLHDAAASADRPRLAAHGHELFADAFAAAAAGPAYTHCYLRYRFTPTAGPTATHPSAARRVRTQLAVLRRLAAKESSDYLAGEITILEDFQTAALAAVDELPAEPADAGLDELEEEMVKLAVEDESLRRVAYGDHLTSWLLADDRLQTEERFTIAHIVNAAWHARSAIEREIADTEKAVALINEISARACDLLGKAA